MRPTQRQTDRSFRRASTGVSLLLMASLVAAPGCGGGSSRPAIPGPGSGVGTPTAGRGQVRFTIRWPEKADPTRLIPRAAESIKFRCLEADDEDEVISEVVVSRQQTVVTLDLPSVRVRIEAEARANADGSGQILAQGGATVTVKEAKVTAQSLTLDSVITEVKLSRNDVSVSGDQAVEVTADAVDADGAVVLTAPESWEWTPEDASAGDIVSYQPTANTIRLQAVKTGSAAFTVKETESGKSARLTVTSQAAPPDGGPGPVIGQPGYVVEPSTITLTAGDIIYPKFYYRDAAGNLTPTRPTYYGYSGVSQFYSLSDGTVPLLATKQGEDTLGLQFGDNGPTVEVPIKVSGYLLMVTVDPGPDGTRGEIEVYVDAAKVYSGSGSSGPTLLSRLLGGGEHTAAIPLPTDLKPGRHYFYAKGVADSPVPFRASIVGVATLSGTVSRDEYVTDVFYKN